MEKKTCCVCKEEKPLVEFYKRKGRLNSFSSNCRHCGIASLKKYREQNTEKYRQKCKEYNRNNPRRKLKKYWPNLSYAEAENELNRLLVAQSHVCAICGNPETRLDGVTGKTVSLAIDHCHSTGIVRGLLCFSCNIAVGKLKDSPTLARKLADYLESTCQRTDIPVNAETNGNL